MEIGKWLAEEYVAGFFDGEGCIGLYGSKSSRSCCLRVTIVQAHTADTEELLKHLAGAFGGSLTVQTMTDQRDKLQWQLSGVKAASFLRSVQGSLRLKAKQCVTALEWFDGRGYVQRGTNGRVLPKADAELARDQYYINLLKEMKKDGHVR